MKTETVIVQEHFYWYSEDCFGNYILRRPSGQEIAYLQGDDAWQFQKELENLDKIQFASLELYCRQLSIIIDQYDLA